MIITITPDDIIKRCLWSSYRRFSLRGIPEAKVELIVKENKPISIDEELAYVIGLLKVIETDNLIHRFDSHMMEILRIKSTIQQNEVYISMRVVEMELDNFKKRFPSYWIPDSNYEKSLVELKEYVESIQAQIPDVEILEFKVKERMVKYFSSKVIKKLIKKTPS
jgi:hypothetical protein